jgi:hypothetical protein
MCKKSEKGTCTPKYIVEEMRKQWRIKDGQEKGKEDVEEETTLMKVDDKAKEKGKGGRKAWLRKSPTCRQHVATSAKCQQVVKTQL